MPPSAETEVVGTAATKTNKTMANPGQVRDWLAAHHPKQLGLLDKFEMELRIGRLSTASSTAAGTGGTAKSPIVDVDRRILLTVRTVDLLKQIVGGTRWKTPAQLMALLKGLGRELHCAGGFREPAIGNVVRRVLAAVRDETMSPTTNTNETGDAGGTTTPSGGSSTTNAEGGGGRRTLSSMLWSLPQGVKPAHARRPSGSSAVSASSALDQRSTSKSSILPVFDEDAEEANQTALSMDLPPVFYDPRPDLKQTVMEVIQETMSDLEDLHKTISDQAIHHIHAGEIIFTYGRSKTVELFLKSAAAKLKSASSGNSDGPVFTVIVAEGAPQYDGHDMAKALTESSTSSASIHPKIETIVISDAAIFAIMSRVHKVILPAHAVLANGGLIAPKSGSHMVALAAKQNSVPVLCCTGMFKLTPLYPHEQQNTLNDFLGPSTTSGSYNTAVVDYTQISNTNNSGGTGSMTGVELINPVHDYIRPELITLYVTNVGSFQPSYIYRLLAEYYHPDDWESFE